MSTQNNIETAATEVFAAASKTPFKTAFMLTLGVGLGRMVLGLVGFAGFLGIIALFINLIK